MKFVNRSNELKYLKETIQLSKNKLFTLSISGLRRVGKTRLILETLKDKDIYFFVNKNKESKSLLGEYENILKEKNILTELEVLRDWDNFFDVLFKRFKGVVVFDEFQNFASVDSSIFGILQKQIDLNEDKRGTLLIFSGSIVGIMKKLFSDTKEPLYGRLKRKMRLQPLPFRDCVEMCNQLNIKNIEEVIEVYTIFGGYPKYYVTIEDENLLGKSTKEILDKLFFQENAVLEEEVNQILSLEFGRRTGVYYDILTAIANGNTRIGEIASFMRKKETDLTRQINELINYFELVGVESPAIKGRNLLYIKHPLINFWFRFFYKNLSSYKRRESWLIEKIRNEINIFIGRGFEQICQEFVVKNCPFKFSKIGRQWGKIPKAERGENTYEIDIVALSGKTKEILFAECKWQDDVDAERVLKELKEKSQYIQWNNNTKKEYFAIFAKSFKRKAKGCLCFDVKDLYVTSRQIDTYKI